MDKFELTMSFILFVFVELICIIGSPIDLRMNPWIAGMNFVWWNFFTTPHYMAWLFATNKANWLVTSFIWSCAVTLQFTFYCYLS